MKRAIVLIEFADKNDFTKRYKVGEELKGFDKERIASLVERGLVGIEKEPNSSNKTKEEDEAKSPDVVEIDMSGNYQRVIAQVKQLDDIEALKHYLEIENTGAKPRVSVVKAIEERIASLVDE